MNNNSLYLGYPQEIWTGLCNKTEDLFCEEEIGQLILGVYPYGDRVFGLEQADPEILCLYTDSEEEVFNPLRNINKPLRLISEDLDFYINFMDLWTWVASFEKTIEFHHLIPCFYDNLFEENLLNEDVIIYARKFIQNNLAEYRYQVNNILDLRSLLVFLETKQFVPNINPEWGSVAELSFITSNIDKEIRKYLLENKTKNSNLERAYINLLSKYIVREEKKINDYFNDLKKLGQKTSEFYRKII